MYRNAYQRGMLTVFFSGGSNPLRIWDTRTQDGYISRFLDQDIKSMVLEIGGTNVSTTYMTCPKGSTVLGITMPFLIMVVKNLKKYFTFEVTILDETSTRRRFRVSNFQSTTQILPLCTVMPIGLSEGWNQIQFNLAEFTRRAYKKQFVEVQKIKINANIRLRRIYFTERLIPEDELPPEYKLYFPLPSKGAKGKKSLAAEEKEEENIQAAQPEEKKEEPFKPEEIKGSKTDVPRGSSKLSVHSGKKVSSIQTSKTKLEGVPEGEASASKRVSAASIPAAVVSAASIPAAVDSAASLPAAVVSAASIPAAVEKAAAVKGTDAVEALAKGPAAEGETLAGNAPAAETEAGEEGAQVAEGEAQAAGSKAPSETPAENASESDAPPAEELAAPVE